MAEQPPISPYEVSPPTSARLWKGIAAALLAAFLILVLFVLPAEYGIDPTGAGRAMGLTAIDGPAPRTLQIKDVIGGNENYREVEIPDAGDPTPLPNPAVSQVKADAPQKRTMVITIPAFQQTEVKAVLDAAQVILYSWKADRDVYVDFHGHEPNAGKEFVRYEEHQETRGGNGSLVAPFSGEHGWFWLSLSEEPVTITLEISGYYNDIIDYGIFE